MISFYDLNKKTIPQHVYQNTKDIEELKQQIGTWYNTKYVLTKESTSIPRVETDVPADVTQGFILTESGLLFKITGVYSDLLYITYYSELQQGPQGIQGPQGVGIEKIESNGYTDAEGYTLTHIDALLTNGTTEHFDVQAKQGPQGQQGVGIEKIESNGYTDAEGYTLTHIDALLTNGTTEHFDVQAKQGPQGPQGPAGSEPVAVTITPDSASTGTLTQEQFNILQESVKNYIVLANEIYILMDNQHESGFLIYSHVCQDNLMNYYIKCIVITISTLGWIRTTKKDLKIKTKTYGGQINDINNIYEMANKRILSAKIEFKGTTLPCSLQKQLYINVTESTPQITIEEINSPTIYVPRVINNIACVEHGSADDKLTFSTRQPSTLVSRTIDIVFARGDSAGSQAVTIIDGKVKVSQTEKSFTYTHSRLTIDSSISYITIIYLEE